MKTTPFEMVFIIRDLDMFNNIGEKIKGIASLSCYIGIGCSILMGLLLLMTFGLIGILVAVFGSFLAWVGSLAVYGFGQLVENSNIQRRYLEKQLALLQNISVGQKTDEPSNQPKNHDVTPIDTAPEEPKEEEKGDASPENPAVFPARTDEFISCPRCKKRQRGNRDLCWNCALPFQYENEI